MRCWCDRVQMTLGTRHTDRADMRFKVVFLISANTSELNPYTLPRTELFHNDISELPICMHGTNVSTVYVSKQRRLIYHTVIIV